jgi:hypothetical protein
MLGELGDSLLEDADGVVQAVGVDVLDRLHHKRHGIQRCGSDGIALR